MHVWIFKISKAGSDILPKLNQITFILFVLSPKGHATKFF